MNLWLRQTITGDRSCSQGTKRSDQHDSFREMHVVEHGGEAGRRAPYPNVEQPSGGRYTQNGYISHQKISLTKFQNAEWTVVEPIPPEALATSLPPSPLEATSHTTPEEKKKMSVSREIENSANSREWTSSHSISASSRTSSQTMSLDSKNTLYKGSKRQLRYRRPQSPSFNSFVAVKQAKGLSGVSEDDLKLLSKLRRRVQLLRLQVQGQRLLVDSKREAQSDADEQYIKMIRTHHALNEPGQMSPSNVVALENLWRLCQAARDEYGPAADSLVSMEYRLEVEEARLERTEERIYDRFDVSQSASHLTSLPMDLDLDLSEDGGSSPGEDHDESSDKSTQASQPTSNVGYNDYLWRLGNLDLLQERHQGLINEKMMLEEEQAKRQRLGVDLDEEDLEFLAHFEENIVPVKKELEEVSEDVKRLKRLCIEKGLMTADGKPTQLSALDEVSTLESGEESQSELPAEQSKLPQHQVPSGNNEAGFSVSPSHGGFGPFINLWLLHKLRSSAMEILLLATYVAAIVGNIDGLNWQTEAFRLWERDGTQRETPGEIYNRLERHIISSLHQYYETILKFDEGKNAAATKKAFSLNSAASRISRSIKSWFKPRPNSTV